MWLKIDLEGIDFHFRISNYKKSTSNWGDEWSRIDLTLQSRKWLDYQIVNDELLLMCEIETLRDNIKALLSDEIDKIERVECIEPDLTFVFFPKYDLRNDSKYTYVAPGYEIVDIHMELEVAFWNGGLTANRLMLSFDRSDLEIFLCYLDLITKQLEIQDKKVIGLIDNGTLYG
ncbi:MAG: hypothetical protein RR552_05710 [Oscillospiraceae bacterium]